jgi:hypothetical protein
VVVRDGDTGEGEITAKEYRVSFWGDGNVLEYKSDG